MATLVFGALGTLVGGPLGGALGSLLGREVDRAIIGAPVREGPRLKELPVTSSSYGQPIARLFGTTRAAGTIIWATPMRESRETAGGGKGQPKTANYSYSISLAVALSSRPILGVGRIWADGNLLRGAGGDLKTGGVLRLHTGHGDQAPDPLLAAALGAQCPAHRGVAYAVFEGLQLGDFGNRIPALSFEVFADGGGERLIGALLESAPAPVHAGALPAAAPIAGFAHDGGGFAAVLDALGPLVPMTADAAAGGVVVQGEDAVPASRPLPDAIAWPDGEFGTRTGRRIAREQSASATALRYYDSARDYQPGVQRVVGRAAAAGERTLELPATLSAAGAAALVEDQALRAAAGAERAQMRVASLDPAFAPGRLVEAPGEGRWRIASWEWRHGGVELELVRPSAWRAAPAASDPGAPWRPLDRLPVPSVLHAFELPWDGAGTSEAARVTVAAGAAAGRWAGASLYVERGGALIPLGQAAPPAAVTGVLTGALAGSPALMFEPKGAIEVECDDPDARFAPADGAALAAGANRLLVGEEILQFLHAEPVGAARWRLSGLLRGRGATEPEARAGHLAGARVVLLDERLQLLDGGLLDAAQERIAAIGVGDPEPVYAAVAAPGRSRRPLVPVHPVADAEPGGGLALAWTRRARGAWAWADGVDVPLVEESEAYEVGAGPVAASLATWAVDRPAIAIAPAALAVLPPGTPLWVRQVGRHARSPALLLHTLS